MLSEMYVFWALQIAVILLVCIESMEVGLLARVRLDTKLFYMAMVMEARLPSCPVWAAVSVCVSSTATQGCHKGALLICCLCNQVEPAIGFFRVSTISEVCIALAELRTWFLLPFSLFNVGFLVGMWLGEESFIACSQPAQDRSVRLSV